MLYSDLCDKEVISITEGRYLGHIRDLEIDERTGRICSIIVPGQGKFMGMFCKEYEYCIPWVKICKIGPDIILVELNECEMKRKI